MLPRLRARLRRNHLSPTRHPGFPAIILITWLAHLQEGEKYSVSILFVWLTEVSLISIMIGRLRMNIDDCISDYETLGAKVFGRSRWFSIRMSPFFWIRDKYDHKILQDVVRDVVRKRVPKVAEFPGGRNFAFDENRCRV